MTLEYPNDLEVRVPDTEWKTISVTVLTVNGCMCRGNVIVTKIQGGGRQSFVWTGIYKGPQVGWDIQGEGALLASAGSRRAPDTKRYPFTLDGQFNNGLRKVLADWVTAHRQEIFAKPSAGQFQAPPQFSELERAATRPVPLASPASSNGVVHKDEEAPERSPQAAEPAERAVDLPVPPIHGSVRDNVPSTETDHEQSHTDGEDGMKQNKNVRRVQKLVATGYDADDSEGKQLSAYILKKLSSQSAEEVRKGLKLPNIGQAYVAISKGKKLAAKGKGKEIYALAVAEFGGEGAADENHAGEETETPTTPKRRKSAGRKPGRKAAAPSESAGGEASGEIPRDIRDTYIHAFIVINGKSAAEVADAIGADEDDVHAAYGRANLRAVAGGEAFAKFIEKAQRLFPSS